MPPSDKFARARHKYRPAGMMCSWMKLAHLWEAIVDHWLLVNFNVPDIAAESRDGFAIVVGRADLLPRAPFSVGHRCANS